MIHEICKKLGKKKSQILVFILFFVFFSSLKFQCFAYEEINKRNIWFNSRNYLFHQQSLKQITRTPHNPISIHSNSDFINQSKYEGWLGDGSSSNPYQIKNYNIDADGNSSAINIIHTTVYFQIMNVYVTGALDTGISLYHVQNGYLENNTAAFNSCNGFFLEDNGSNNILINNIAISNDENGFQVIESNGNKLSNNYADSNGHTGFALFENSDNNTLSNNIATSNDINGFTLNHCNNNTLIDNIANSNKENGFHLDESENNTLINNAAANNAGLGLRIINSKNNNLISNDISDNNIQDDYNNKIINDFSRFVVGVGFITLALLGIRSYLKARHIRQKNMLIPPEPTFSSRIFISTSDSMKSFKQKSIRKTITKEGLQKPCKYCGKPVQLKAFICPYCYGELH